MFFLPNNSQAQANNNSGLLDLFLLHINPWLLLFTTEHTIIGILGLTTCVFASIQERTVNS